MLSFSTQIKALAWCCFIFTPVFSVMACGDSNNPPATDLVTEEVSGGLDADDLSQLDNAGTDLASETSAADTTTEIPPTDLSHEETTGALDAVADLVDWAHNPCGDSTGSPSFRNVASVAGLGNESYWVLNSHGLGVLWLDFDRDGWVDIFATNGECSIATLKCVDEEIDQPHLYRNNGNGTFTLRDDLLPEFSPFEFTSAVFADYDNDGDDDIYLTAEGYDEVYWTADPAGEPNVLLHNNLMENGATLPLEGPLFEDRALEAGVDNRADPPVGVLSGYRSMTATFFDYDRDGWADLFVGNWLPDQPGSEGKRNFLYRNRGDGTFEDVSIESGVGPIDDPSRNRTTLAAIAADFNQDFWPDLYTINAHDDDPDGLDALLINNQDGTFTLSTVQPEIGDDAGSGMGIDISDIDHNGTWDIWISDLETQRYDATPFGVLYLGLGDGTFVDNTAEEANVPGKGLAWGVNFFDLDHDTFEDLFVSTDQLYLNNGDGSFSDVATAAGIIYDAPNWEGRGSAVADYDQDGDFDILVINQGIPLELWQNDTTDTGCWLQVALEGTMSNRSAIGAVVEIDTTSSTLVRTVLSLASAHSQDQMALHFGLGNSPVVNELRVNWPSGEITVLEEISSNQAIFISEGQSDYTVLHRGESFEHPTSPDIPIIHSLSPALVTRGGSLTIYGEFLGDTGLVQIGDIDQTFEIIDDNTLLIPSIHEITRIDLDQSLLLKTNGLLETLTSVDVALLHLSELDADSGEAGTGDFVEIGTSLSSELDLSGYSLLFIDGNSGAVYRETDLAQNEAKTNAEGRLVVAGNSFSGSSQITADITSDLLLNGEHAVALYQQGNGSTLPTTIFESTEALLIDALIYETGFHDNQGALWSLMTCCSLDDDTAGQSGGPVINEGGTAEDRSAQSIQRCPGISARRDSSAWGVSLATPGEANTCDDIPVISGVDYPVVAHGSRLTISGENLSRIDQVRIGEIELNIIEQTDEMILISEIPDNVSLGTQELSIRSLSGTITSSELVVIHLTLNELDPENGGQEFIELSIGLTASLSLSGYWVALFDGNTPDGAVYGTVYLAPDGIETDEQGLLLIGSETYEGDAQIHVSDFPDLFLSGEHGVAIYQEQAVTTAADLFSLENGGLIDAIIYETGASSNSPVLWDLMTCCNLDDPTEGTAGGPVVSEGDTEVERSELSLERCTSPPLRRDSSRWSTGANSPLGDNTCFD